MSRIGAPSLRRRAAAGAPPIAREGADAQARAPLSQTWNGLTLIGAKALTMGLGFVFWVLAARLFAPTQVGVAAGAVSAMMLCTQFAQLGFGSAFITHFPAFKRRPGELINTSLTLAAAAGVVFGGIFLLFATATFRELDVVSGNLVFALLFVAAAVFGTLGIVFDQIATALRRGDQALVRNLTFGVGTVAVLAAVAVLAEARDSMAIFTPWTAASLAALIIGFRQLRRTLPLYRPRLAVNLHLARELTRAGLPNYALTLSERAPGLILPVIVAELLSPATNATWYTIWMMAWVVYIVPIQVGMTIFSEVSHDPGALRLSIKRGVLCSLAVGAAAALALGVSADLVLSILGKHYAEGGAGPLRVLLLAFIPLTFVQAHFSSCRARRALREAIAAGWISGVASIAAAAAGGMAHGLMGMAIAWVSVQSLTGVWALWRLWVASSQTQDRPRMTPGEAVLHEVSTGIETAGP